MYDHDLTEEPGAPGKPTIMWDANTALVVLVLGALAFLWLIARGFRGFNVSATIG